MATTAKSVLNAASRYRWHRALQLLEQGIFTEEEVGSDAAQMEQPAIAQLASDSDWGPTRRSGCRGCPRVWFLAIRR